MARDSIPDELDLDINQAEILRAILAGVLATGDVIGHDEAGRVILAVAVEGWLFDELAALDADLEDLEPEPDEDDDPSEDEEGVLLYLGAP